ncbi:LamG-like jellyroll fold domain-containing protein [Priestia megaterium]
MGIIDGRIVQDSDGKNIVDNLSTVKTNVSDLTNGKLGTSIKKSVQTTQGRFWQGTTEQINTTIGGEERQVKTTPTTFKKRIVLIGSSSAQGNGVADYTTSSFWALLKAKLEPKGYEVLNRGFSADDTGKGIERFYRDVITANPDYVILSFTIGNEGITNTGVDKYTIYNQFKNNILKMCYMTKQIGAVPIVMTQAPTKSFTKEIYNYAQKFNSELEALGIHAVDWSGAVDAMTGDGKPILSIMYDNVHYNEAAHVEIANAFPPTLFDRVGFESGSYLTTQKGYINYNTPISQTPIYYDITDITTFTAFMRFRKSTAETASFMSFSNGIRTFMDGSGYVLWNDNVSGNIQADATNYANNAWHSIAVSYSPIDQKVKIYMDGVLKFTTTSTVVPTRWTIGGRSGSNFTFKNGDVKDLALYRTRLTDTRIMQMHQGTFTQTSLEIYSPCHDKNIAAGMPLINLAPTTVNLRVDATETALTSPSNPSI